MNQKEVERIMQQLVVTAEVMGHELKPTAVMVMAQDLAEYNFSDVMVALTRCRKEIIGKLTLKAIIDLLAPQGGWISANEAWSLALPAADERNSVVWTEEAKQAWSVALPLMESGDKVGARMAFIAAYDRNVATAKSSGKTPHNELSAGWDGELRQLVEQKAQQQGLLPPPRTEHLALPNLSPEVANSNRQKIAEGLRELSKRMAITKQQEDADRRERHAVRMKEVNRRFDEQRAEWQRRLENDDE